MKPNEASLVDKVDGQMDANLAKHPAFGRQKVADMVSSVSAVQAMAAKLPGKIGTHKNLNQTALNVPAKDFSFGDSSPSMPAARHSESKGPYASQSKAAQGKVGRGSGLSLAASASPSGKKSQQDDAFRRKAERADGKFASVIADVSQVEQPPQFGSDLSPFKEFKSPLPVAASRISNGIIGQSPTPSAVPLPSDEPKGQLNDSFQSLSLKGGAGEQQPLAELDQGGNGAGAQQSSDQAGAAKLKTCSPVLYDEFLNCNSYLYKMEEKDDSEQISSDGEFNEFKQVEMVAETDQMFVAREYERLVLEKYGENKVL